MNFKRESFCREYILDGNATRAAIAAGYSKRTADRMGSRLLKSVEVREQIARMRQAAISSAEAEVFASFRRKREILKAIITDTEAATRDRLKAIEVDNVMAGDNAPQRMDVTSNAEPIRPVIHFTQRPDDGQDAE